MPTLAAKKNAQRRRQILLTSDTLPVIDYRQISAAAAAPTINF